MKRERAKKTDQPIPARQEPEKKLSFKDHVKKDWDKALFLAIFVFVAYLPALQAGFVWDDDAWVTENSQITHPSYITKIWLNPADSPQGHYWPMTHTSFWLDYRLWDLAPQGYHLTNIVLHIANVLLIWMLLRRMGVPGAWLIGAVFALHPVHVESVAWITERKNVLSFFFYLLAFHTYLYFDQTRSWKWYGRILVLFAAALLSKSIVVTFPVAILIWLWWKKGRLTGKDIWPVVPLFVMAGFSAWIYIHFFRQNVDYQSGLSIAERLIVAGRAFWFYVGKVLWPASLVAIYPRWEIDSSSLAQFLYPLAIIPVLIWLWLERNRFGRGPLACVLFFGVTLGPVLNLLDVGPYMDISFVNDHALYPASLGLIVLVVAGCVIWVRQQQQNEKVTAVVLTVVVFLAMGLLSWSHTSHYRDMTTLFQHTLEKNPRAFAAYNNVGYTWFKEGRIKQAREYFEKAIEIQPNFAGALYNLGVLHASVRDPQTAANYYRKAVKSRPSHIESRINLAVALLQIGQPVEAVHHLRRALEWQPGSISIQKNLAVALAESGEYEESAKHFQKAFELSPEDIDLRFNHARLLMKMNRLEEAQEELKSVLDQEPDDSAARFQLAQVLLALNRDNDAVAELQQMLKDDSKNIQAKTRLAWVLATSDDEALLNPEEAVRLAEDANQQTGGVQMTVLDTLAAAYASAGRFDEALFTAQRALNGAKQQNATQLVEEIESRLENYRNKHAYIDQ